MHSLSSKAIVESNCSRALMTAKHSSPEVRVRVLSVFVRANAYCHAALPTMSSARNSSSQTL
ncbi:MAG: hypothetical protein ACI8PT_004090, partial [Gammaproteobacteria bacterium]